MNKLINLLTLPFSLIYWVLFFLTLICFHGIQWVAFKLFGYQAHKKMVDVMNWLLIKMMLVAGVRFHLKGYRPTAADAPAIIVSNHQSMFDIPPMIWFLRKLHPKFIAKKELGRGLPGISYNLRHGGSILIDRNNRKSAVAAIESMARYIEKHGRSVIIYPEGTRSDSPKPRPWRPGGVATLVENAKNAVVLPITINGSWKVLKYKGWPIPFGSNIEIMVHDPMKYDGKNLDEFVRKVQYTIESSLAINRI